ncbi:MAG: septum formation protein Maf [Bacteroidales bacterium]|nr:septum formation protein Maf [Bacteroidales bacterium]
MKLLLASKSPRRRQLLGELGFPVEFITLDVDEHVAAGTPAADTAELLACRKAEACPAELIAGDDILVAADTVVVLGDKVLGKPADRNEALAMLRSLSGNQHAVYTGVCLRTATRTLSFTEKTDVFFRQLSDEELAYYVDNYRPFDKAGAYGIQEWIGMVGISRIEGCYYNVMGLPVSRVYEAIRQLNPRI